MSHSYRLGITYLGLSNSESFVGPQMSSLVTASYHDTRVLPVVENERMIFPSGILHQLVSWSCPSVPLIMPWSLRQHKVGYVIHPPWPWINSRMAVFPLIMPVT